MKRSAASILAILVLTLPVFFFPAPAGADEPAPPPTRSAAAEETSVARARDMLGRARFLDEAATADEKVATDLVTRLPALRTAAKAARDRADRTKPTDPDYERLLARAEDLEVDVAVSEAEVSSKRRGAAENRRVAKDLRARAVRLVRDGTADDKEAALASACDPPYRFTADGRKIYRIDCLK